MKSSVMGEGPVALAPQRRQSNRRRAPVRSPAPQVCDICGGARAHRRGSCWTCYRKFLQAGLPLPLRIADRESDPLLAWAHALTKPQLRRVMAALRRALAPRSPAAPPSPSPAGEELDLFSLHKSR